MEHTLAKAAIEAILFAMGESVEVSRLADAIGEDVKTTREILGEMEQEYRQEGRGIGMTWFDSAVQLCTKAEMYEYLIRIAKAPRKMVLTDTVIETLSIIAYKQPITRVEIERIRGVSCDHAINKLLEYDLVTELGRLDAPGRPLLFGTTQHGGIQTAGGSGGADAAGDMTGGICGERLRRLSENRRFIYLAAVTYIGITESVAVE